MPTSRRFAVLPLLPAILLSACGEDPKPQAKSVDEGDAALSGALADQIMVDPDLAGQNQAGGGIAVGTGSAALPPEDNSPEAIAAARQEALAMVGGSGKMQEAPKARNVSGNQPVGAELTAASRAAATSRSGADCAGKVQYTMVWADRLPETFPVYPRGNVQEAAGTDQDGCALRVVNFTTPVPLNEVMNFYYTRASAAGFKADRARQGEDDMLGGSKGTSSYVIYTRRLSTGRTEVDLVTNGR